jgi:uncharacterized protein YhhL (DUF1145 family)
MQQPLKACACTAACFWCHWLLNLVKPFCRWLASCLLALCPCSLPLQPLLMHNSILHICAAISDNSFINWALSNRIGSSYALLALSREPRTWLQMADACVERAVLNMMLDPCNEVPPFITFHVAAHHVACSGANKRPPHGHCDCSAWT